MHSYCCLPVSSQPSGYSPLTSGINKVFSPRELLFAGYFLGSFPVNPSRSAASKILGCHLALTTNHLSSLLWCPVWTPTGQWLLKMTMCLNELNCCHVIGWIDFCINKHLNITSVPNATIAICSYILWILYSHIIWPSLLFSYSTNCLIEH